MYMIYANLEFHLPGQPSWLCLAIYRRQRIWSRGWPANHMWKALLRASRIHIVMWKWENILLNEFIELELENAVGYVLLSNYIYAELLTIGNYVQNVQWQRRERGEKKQQGPTRIGMNNMAFVVDNQDHPQMIEICSQLMRLLGLIHDVGYATQGLFLAMSNLVMWYHWKKQPSVQLPFYSTMTLNMPFLIYAHPT